MISISSHVLDTSSGKPANDMKIDLYFLNNNSWDIAGQGITGIDGRAGKLLITGKAAGKGIYKMTFRTGEYFKEKGLKNFYPQVDIIFEIDCEEHYHVPLLLSPFGYSTYRGS